MIKDKELIKPWEHTDVWKTEGQFYTWLRGQLRRLWKDNPVRITFKKSKLRPVTPEERTKRVFHPSTKNVGQCYCCGEWFAGSKLEVDHLLPAGACSSFESSVEFLKAQVYCPPDNMDLVCKPCHKIKTFADKQDIPFEEAKAEKAAIAFVKQPIPQQEAFFKEKGISVPSNAKKRREAYKEFILELEK